MEIDPEELAALHDSAVDAKLKIAVLEALVGAMALGFVRGVRTPGVTSRQNAERFIRSTLAISGLNDLGGEAERAALTMLREFGQRLVEMAEPGEKRSPQ